jgi:DNA-binding transcriptional regulator YiaG
MQKYKDDERKELAAAGKRIGLDLPRIQPKRRAKKEKISYAEDVEAYADRQGFPKLKRAENPARPWCARTPEEIKETKHPIKALNGRNGQAIWQKKILELDPVGPLDLKHWRLYYLNITQDECARLLRIPLTTYVKWEAGKQKIPFLMWYMVHCVLQWDEVRLSKAGFADFYINYQNGNAYLCSAEYPDIKFAPADLAYFGRAIQHLNNIEKRNKELQAQVDRLTFENTELRRMYKANKVTAQVEAMQEQINALMMRLNTADVMPFEAPQERMPATTLSLKVA